MWSCIKVVFVCCFLVHQLLGAAEDHRCLICNSSETGCEEGLLKFVRNCTHQDDSCFTRVVDGLLMRGCLSQLATAAEEHQQCAEVDGGACISCTENECNRHTWLKCVQCDDGEPKHGHCSDKQEARFCPQYRSEDRCYEMARAIDGHDQQQLVRNCYSTLQLTGCSCNVSEQCVIISPSSDAGSIKATADTSSKCLVCISEGSDDDDQCLQGTAEPQDCPQPNDKCFSRLHGNVLQRNCLSTLTVEEQEACTDSIEGSCISCSEGPGCNNDRLLRCLQCKTPENVYCFDPEMSSTLTATFCPRFQPDAQCFSRALGSEVERGCTSSPDLPGAVCEGNKRCLLCADDGCNVIPDSDLLNVQTCVRCVAQGEEALGCESASIEPDECDGLIDECFTRIKDGAVERNCLSTLAEEDQAKCRDDNDMSCVACIGQHCNDYTWLRCYQCTKRQEPRCAAPATNDLYAGLCNGFQIMGQCYARIVADDVQRGCVIDLPSQEDACGGNPMCAVCTDDSCNSIDEDTLRRFTKCITCSTVDGKEACEQAEPTTTAEVCGEMDDVCFTRVNEGHLERGCLSTLDDDEQQQCKDPADTTCNTCRDLSCNSASWLKCAKCKSSENPLCAVVEGSTLEEMSAYCARHNAHSTCYSRLVQDVLERGCTLELDDTQSVCDGSAGCATCASDSCNTHTKESLLSGIACVQCASDGDGSGCNGELPNPAECPNQDDRCFTRVADGMLTRNCLSSLDESAKEACSNPDDFSCIVCGESGCNKDHWFECHQCAESTHAACTEEQQVTDATYCKMYHSNDQCYTKINNNQLERGCQSDAGSGADICSGAEVCVTCQEDACNSAAGSTLEHTKCQQCTTTEGEGCALGAVESKRCPQKVDQCYTAVTDGNVLTRGCLSMVSEELREVCSDEANLSCVTCAENGCNRLPWPECYRCQSSTEENCERSLTTEQLRFCSSYRETSLCFASIVGDVLSRDCVPDGEHSVCENNKRCVACSNPGCNAISKEALETVHTCFQCSSDDGDCDVLEGPGVECNQRNDRCYTQLAGGTLTRGCLSAIDADECHGNDDCLVCEGRDCNRFPWPKCYQCSNATSADCVSVQNDNDRLAYCQDHEKADCFSMVREQSFVRGCVSDLEDNQCTASKQCFACTGAGCNSLSQKSLFNPAFCQQCHSDLNPGCLEGTVEPAWCEDPDDVCFYRRTSAKAIHRGCLSELASTDQDKCRSPSARSCHTCEHGGCNSAKWRACFQCSTFTDLSCGNAQNSSEYLKLCERMDDSCYENRNDFEVRRGCGLFFCESHKTCVECHQDGCNGNSASTLMPSHCLVCESSDPFCANGNSFDQYCNYINEPCFSRVEDGTLHRGCYSHLTSQQKSKCLDSKDQTCITCVGNSCNRMLWRLCLQCRSVELGHYCSREASPLKSHYCKRYVPNDRCYTKEINDVVSRGCESDYDSPEDVCEELDRKQCITCQKDNCNDKSLNGVPTLPRLAFILYISLSLAGCVLHFDKYNM